MWGSAVNTGIIQNWFGLRRQRGTAVPFEAPVLNMARVCDDERDGLIAVLRDFANNGSAYIVPWNSLPLVVAMTEQDKALHKAVEEAKPSTPAEMRAVMSSLALSGALGPTSQAHALEHAHVDQSALSLLELLLVLHLLDSCGADLLRLLASADRWRDKYAKSAVAATATALGVRRQDIHERVAEFAKLLVPIGLAVGGTSIRPGWLRVLRDEIEGFSSGLRDMASNDYRDVDEYLRAIADCAGHTGALSGIVLGMIDYAVLDIGGTVRRWTTERPVLQLTVERLSQTLDEWPALMKQTRDALRGPEEERGRRLRMLVAMLPPLPAAELSADQLAPDGHAVRQSVSRALAARLTSIWGLVSAAEPQAA